MKVVNNQGQLKSTGSGGGGSITVEEVDGTPSVASVTIVQFNQTDGFTVTEPVAGTARVSFTGGSAVDNNAQLLAMLAVIGF